MTFGGEASKRLFYLLLNILVGSLLDGGVGLRLTFLIALLVLAVLLLLGSLLLLLLLLLLLVALLVEGGVDLADGGRR